MKKLGLLCMALVLGLGAMGGGLAYFSDTATMTATLTAGEWELGGSAGFWKNWHKHDTYTESEILGFLSGIDVSSQWLVPDKNENGVINISDMQAVFAAGQGETMEEKFLRQYLATRLNTEAGRLYPDTFHNFSICDSINYLDLGGRGTLQEIITAIEGNHGTSPTEDQFEVMKDVCEALNELEI